MEELESVTSFIDSFDAFNSEIPLLQQTLNELISGGRTVGQMLDLTDWVNNLEGSIVQTEAVSTISAFRCSEESNPLLTFFSFS